MIIIINMRISLRELFSGLNDNYFPCNNNADLFGFAEDEPCVRRYEQTDIDFLNAYFSGEFNASLLKGQARRLFDISFNAFDIFLHAWLSELPVEKETINYGRKIIAVSQTANTQEQKRNTAENITANRTDSDTLAVLNAAGKTGQEAHRMMGLLRFSPNKDGEFIARCEPDHFILPSLGEYFTSRFGETSWSIIDIKRSQCLRRIPPKPAKTCIIDKTLIKMSETNDEWEDLWKHYHKIINNEDRNNPDLQRQFMPKRYWKYLPEK